MGRNVLLAALLTASLAPAARADSTAAPQPPPQGFTMTDGMFVAAEVSLALDMLQTSSAVHAGLQEKNPLLGPRPSDGKLLAYFGSCMLATAAGTYLLPDSLRPFAPVLVLMLEIPQIAQNASVRWGLRLPF